MAGDSDLRECPAGCGRDDLRGAQGVATHLSRSHPDYDRGEDDALDRAADQGEGVVLEFRVAFPADEVVLLQALTFLGGYDLNDLAALAFDDLFKWARDREDVAQLIDLRAQWRGALVQDGDGERPDLAIVPTEP